jgi:hypothetical protein
MSNEEQYELQQELLNETDSINEQLVIAKQIDDILANINPHTVRSIIYSLVHQHPRIADTMLEELDL